MITIPRPKVLVSVADAPFPARRNGMSIRYSPIFEQLLHSYEVHLLIIGDNALSDDDRELCLSHVKRVDAFHRLRVRQPLGRKLATRLRTLLPGTTPFPVFLYDELLIEEFVRKTTATEDYDVALISTPKFAQIIQRVVNARRFVIDAIDSEYVGMSRLRSHPMLRYDSYRVREWERRLARSAHFWSFVSMHDAVQVFGPNFDHERVGVIPNGVFLEDYEPTSWASAEPVVGYLGNMGYPPNVSAAMRLIQLFRQVRRAMPSAQLQIIGRSPVPELCALDGQDGISVTGTVPSIWPYVHETAVFGFPMTQGAGQQNKVLEAMVAGVPVVTTSIGNSGINATHNEGVIIADDDAAFVSALIELLQNPAERARIGAAGRSFVLDRFNWSQSLAEMKRRFLGVEFDDRR